MNKLVKVLVCSTIILISACSDDESSDNNVVVTNLDTGFGTDGYVTTQMDDSGTQSQIQRILIDSTDKIYAIGWLGDSAESLAVARYTADGELDTTFATNGKLVTDFNGTKFTATDAVFNSDGQLVISGFAGNATLQSFSDMAIAVVNADGSLDTSVDTDGMMNLNIREIVTASSNSSDRAYGIAVSDTTGQFYIGGYSDHVGSKNATVVNLSNTFALGSYGTNTTGAAALDLVTNQTEEIYDIAEVDDQVLIVGSVTTAGENDFIISKLDSTGTLATFGTNNVVSVDFDSADDAAMSVVLVDSDTNAVAIGWSHDTTTNTTNLALVKFAVSDGTLDTNFGTGGKVTIDPENDNTIQNIRDKDLDAVADADGKILVTARTGAGGSRSMSVYRFNADNGLLDSTFGDNGFLSSLNLDIGTSKAIGIQSTGKIILGGQMGSNNDRHFHLARMDN